MLKKRGAERPQSDQAPDKKRPESSAEWQITFVWTLRQQNFTINTPRCRTKNALSMNTAHVGSSFNLADYVHALLTTTSIDKDTWFQQIDGRPNEHCVIGYFGTMPCRSIIRKTGLGNQWKCQQIFTELWNVSRIRSRLKGTFGALPFYLLALQTPETPLGVFSPLACRHERLSAH